MRIRGPGWKKFGSRIRDKHPGSATLHLPILYWYMEIGSNAINLTWSPRKLKWNSRKTKYMTPRKRKYIFTGTMHVRKANECPSPLYNVRVYGGLRLYIWFGHTIHLVWSQEPGQRCTHSGSFWSTLFYTVVAVAMSNLALWTLRNPETAQFFECLILQVKGSLGLPRDKRTVVPLFTFYLKS